MSDPNPVNVLWVEKHRPTALDQMALDPENRKVLESFIEAGEIPHLLLIGPPGSGKTTIARILYRTLDAKHLVLNASSERGIDMIREKVGSFVQSVYGEGRNIVFLDEADAMTADAQTALRNLMEAHAEISRFILSGNYPHKIIGPIQDRCFTLTIGRPPLKERFRILTEVLKAEGIEADPQVAVTYAERFPSLRKMLTSVQRAWLAAENGALPPAEGGSTAGGGELYDLMIRKDWTGLRHLTSSGGFDPTQGLRDLFWAIPDDHEQAGFLRHVIGKGVHESSFTPDPVILFLGVVAEAMEGLD